MGKLTLDYWVLPHNLSKAKKHFELNVKPMLKAYEHWFGPYPFYDDGYKLIEAPYPAMEHQSAISYGNHYLDGTFGNDLSGTGWGKNWDYAIIHESGHEWFWNSITAKDFGDLWIHEAFTNYSEALFVEGEYGTQPAKEYLHGVRSAIANDGPIVGPYGVNKSGGWRYVC